MRCCTSQDHRLPFIEHRCLQPGTAWHQDMCMDTSCHPRDNRISVQDGGIWGQRPLLGQFLKRRVPLQSVPGSTLAALLLMVMLLSWKTCEAGDLNLLANSTFDDIISLKHLDFRAMRRSTREIPGDLQVLRDNVLTTGGHHLNMHWKGKIWPCDVLLKLSQHVLVSALGPDLAWSIFPYDNCDQDLKPTETLISPLKLLQVNVKPMLLHRVLRFLGDLGFLVETQQSKALSLLKKRMYKSGKPWKDPSMAGAKKCSCVKIISQKCGHLVPYKLYSCPPDHLESVFINVE